LPVQLQLSANTGLAHGAWRVGLETGHFFALCKTVATEYPPAGMNPALEFLIADKNRFQQSDQSTRRDRVSESPG